MATRTKKLIETINPVETEISEPKEQIKAWLRSLPGSMLSWSKRDEAMSQAIRSLIEKVFEWQSRAKDICSHPMYSINPNLTMKNFIKKIRDFGGQDEDYPKLGYEVEKKEGNDE